MFQTLLIGTETIIMFKDSPKIAVVGLGYVGLPLAIGLAKHFHVTGFDINDSRVGELKKGEDRTNEISKELLISSTLNLTSTMEEIKGYDVFIVTVPTPVTAMNQPDLTPLAKASETVGKLLVKGSIVVYESTVYPGVTEDYCAPILEKNSGLKCGSEFYLGYSPERINPGDKEHTVDKITKVVSGQTSDVAQHLAMIYGKMNQGNIFIAKNIKTAEAAKVIENAQRDINIAFINEITTIFSKLGLSIYDVLDAASTKWNFLKFLPGMVGGHCIGVDPYYLAHLSRTLNHEPEVILAGRKINEAMSHYIASQIHEKLQFRQKEKPAKILLLGITFKENIPDLRNTKVIDLIKNLKSYGHTVFVHDAYADPQEAHKEYGLTLLPNLAEGGYDCMVGAVAHDVYAQFELEVFKELLKEDALVADVKNIWSAKKLPQGMNYWSL